MAIRIAGKLNGIGAVIFDGQEIPIAYDLTVWQDTQKNERFATGMLKDAVLTAVDTSHSRLRLSDGRVLSISVTEVKDEGAEIAVDDRVPGF